MVYVVSMWPLSNYRETEILKILPSSSLKLVNALDRRLFFTSLTATAATTGDGTAAAAFGAAFGVVAFGLPMELRLVGSVADLNNWLN